MEPWRVLGSLKLPAPLGPPSLKDSMAVSKNQGPHFASPYNKDHNLFGSVWGPLCMEAPAQDPRELVPLASCSHQRLAAARGAQPPGPLLTVQGCLFKLGFL